MALLPSLKADEDRPRIGLVLGGGGALGFAHVGVLKVLEEQQIPIDYITGTSMGAIVAGMYASGMSPEEIEQRFLAIDWWDVLKDRSPNQYLTYRRKVENKRYMGVEFGLKDWQLVFSPGMAYGQKLNNVLGTFAINSDGINDFDQLNIPYRAVATDLRSGTSVVLGTGNLANAMRASMAVPGIFTPVFTGDMVLIDGGILNNIPVDVVKSMGADIVIAVDVGASAAEQSQMRDFTTLGDVVGRTYTIMQRPDQERQLALADIVIAPDLKDAAASQFHRAAEIMPRGQVAAEALTERLRAYSVDTESYADYLAKQRLRHADAIQITNINIIGNDTVPGAQIRHRIRSREGPLELAAVSADLNRIHGIGAFQTVTYELEPGDDGYVLEYNTAEKFWGPDYLHFGMKLEAATDASMLWSVLINYTRTQINPLGGELKFELEGGGHKRSLAGEWYQPVTHGGTFFLAPSIMASSEDIDIYVEDTAIAEIAQKLAYGMLDAGVNGFEFGEFRAGVLAGYALVDGNAGPIPLDGDEDTVVAATTHLGLDQLNDPVFPSKGFRLGCDGLFAFDEAGSSRTFSRLELKTITPISLGRHTFTPRFSGGSSLGSDLPFYSLFYLGGMNSFAGYATHQLFGNYYGVGNFEYRYRIGRLPPTVGNGLYGVLRFDVGQTWFNAEDIEFGSLDYGGLAGLATDTLLGTCTLALGKAEGLNLRFYFSIGNVF